MQYFGGGGVAGRLHPSLQVYIDCFDSPPFPRIYPRGGGVWDQDPILMQHFRAIRNYEIQWKQTQERLSSNDPSQQTEGGTPDLETMLNDMLEEQGVADDQFF